jgi:pimeloyl-ACP methyl ester carboxylesterase
MLLVHDVLTSHEEWDDVLDGLAREHQVVAPDLPGFGESEKPSPLRYAYGLEAFAESMADVIAAFSLGRVTFVGHGLGGAVGLTLAALHPELVSSLVLLAPTVSPALRPLGSKLPLLPLVGGGYVKQVFGRGRFRGYFREQVFSDASAMPTARIDAHYDRFNQPAARESALAVLRSMTDTRSLRARLGRVRAPTLLVWGRDDRVEPVLQGTRLSRELAHARLEVVDAGHSPAEERPSSVLSAIERFLVDAPPSSAT